MPLTLQSSGRLTNCAFALRVASSLAIPFRAHFTLSLACTFAPQTMNTTRPSHGIRLRSARGWM